MQGNSQGENGNSTAGGEGKQDKQDQADFKCTPILQHGPNPSNPQQLCTTNTAQPQWPGRLAPQRGKRLKCDQWDSSPLGNPLLALTLDFRLLCVATERKNSFSRLRTGPEGWKWLFKIAQRKADQEEKTVGVLKKNIIKNWNFSLDVRGKAPN